MSQPNLHHLRKFIDRAESLKGEGQTVLTHSEIRSVALTLGALLVYHKQLEQDIQDLRQKIDQDRVDIEMVGDRF
mgnify:CR=1 FL=1